MAFKEERLQRPGEPKVTNIDIHVPRGDLVDVIGLFGSLTLTEDLFTPHIAGRVELSDSINLLDSYNLTGEERVRVRFGTPTLPVIDFEGSVTGYSPRIMPTDAAMIYSFDFISPEAISSITRRVRKGYHKLSYSDMAKKVYSAYLASVGSVTDRPVKKFRSMPSTGLATIAIPGWRPLDTLSKLAARATDVVPYKNSTFTCTELCDDGTGTIGGYYFYSLERLWEDPKISAKYVWSPKGADTFNQHKNADDFYSVNRWTEKKRMNTVDNILSGMYSSRVVTHDLWKRVLYYTDHNYKSFFERSLHLNTSTSGHSAAHTRTKELTERPESREFYVVKQKAYGDSFGPTMDAFNEVDLLNRNATMQALFGNQVIELSVPGDSRRRCGDIINFSIPSPGSRGTVSGGTPSKDKYITGNYLVTAVTHKILSDPSSYETVMECCKESS